MALACFYADISQPYMDDGEGNGDDDKDALSKLDPEKWAKLRQQLADIKTSLLRKDANALEQDDAEEDETVDETLASLTKFTMDYDAVDALFALHKIVARLRQVLQGLLVPSTKNQKKLLHHQVEQAVNEYKAAVVQVNLTDSVLGELTSFFLQDMPMNTAKDLPQQLPLRIIQHLYDVMANDQNVFSYVQICSKACQLVQQWHSCVLHVPTLVRLGYGKKLSKKMSVLEGRMSSLFDENDSVSLRGVKEEEFQQRKQIKMEQEDAPQKMSTGNKDKDDIEDNKEEDVQCKKRKKKISVSIIVEDSREASDDNIEETIKEDDNNEEVQPEKRRKTDTSPEPIGDQDSQVTPWSTSSQISSVVLTTKLDLWRMARLVWKERFDEDMPKMTSAVHICKGKGMLWSQAIIATNGEELSTSRECFPCALDNIMNRLPEEGGIAFTKLTSARIALLWNIICTIPLQANRLKWANDILQDHLSKNLSTMNLPLWCTLSRDSTGVVWVEFKERKMSL